MRRDHRGLIRSRFVARAVNRAVEPLAGFRELASRVARHKFVDQARRVVVRNDPNEVARFVPRRVRCRRIGVPRRAAERSQEEDPFDNAHDRVVDV